MHIDWSHAVQYAYENRLPISATLGLVVTAAVKVWPTPDRKWFSVQTAKEFFYDFSHQYLNVTNSRKQEQAAAPKQ
jgi:hypothetical protein